MIPALMYTDKSSDIFVVKLWIKAQGRQLTYFKGTVPVNSKQTGDKLMENSTWSVFPGVKNIILLKDVTFDDFY